MAYKLPYWGFGSCLHNNHHGDIEEGKEEDGEEEEDDEGDLVDWVPLKQKAGDKWNEKLAKRTSGMSSMAQKADSGAGGPSG